MMLPAGQYSSTSQRRNFGLVLLILVALLVLQNLEPACGSGTTPATARSAARRMLSTSPLTPGFKHIGILGYWKDRDKQQFTNVKRRSLVVLKQAPVGYYPPIAPNHARRRFPSPPSPPPSS